MALKSQNLHKSKSAFHGNKKLQISGFQHNSMNRKISSRMPKSTKSIEKAIKNTINPIRAWGSFGHPFIGWIFSVKFF